MNPMIEALAARTLFSASPAVVAFRRDVAALSAPVVAMKRTCGQETTQIAAELKIFKSSTSPTLVSSLRTTFLADVKTLASDVNTAKALLVRDLNHVLADQTLVRRHPSSVGAADQLTFDQGLLSQQANAAETALGSDVTELGRGCGVDLSAITSAHVIDATLANETGAFAGTVLNEGNVLIGEVAHIAASDVPGVVRG